MGTTTKGYTPTTGAIPTAAQWNAMVDPMYTEINGLLDENNVAWNDSDGIVTVQQTQSISGAKTFSNAAGVVVNYGLNLGGTSASASAWGLAGINLEAKAGTYTDSSTSGSATATNAAVNSFAVPTLAATNSSVTTTYASTVYIAGAPAAGTNQTLTNAYALWVDAGAVRLDGAVTMASTLEMTGDLTLLDNVKLTLGTGGDADLYYDATDVILDPRVVGSGVFRVLNEAEVRGDAAAAGILTLSTAETTVVNGNKLGQIDFQAPLDTAGTDAILVAASIWAEADDTFAAGINDADLVFAVAESETALERMRLAWDGTTTNLHFAQVANISSGGDITLTAADDVNIPADIGLTFGDDGEKILGDGTDLTVSSSGLLTLTATGNTVVTNNAVVSGTLASGVLTVTGAILPNADDGGALGASGTEFSDLFLHTGGVINWEAGDVTLTHAAGKLTFGGDGAVELDFNNHEMTNVDVNSGAIDGTVIGAASVAAGSFAAIVGTTITGSGILSVAGATTLTGTLTVGVDDVGLDVKFFGAAAGSFFLWDESENSLKLTDSTPITLGDSDDATVQFDGTNTVIATAAQLVITPTTDTIFSNGTGVVFGHNAQITMAFSNPEFQVLGTATVDSTIVAGEYSANNVPPMFRFLKSRASSIGGSAVIVADNDQCGEIEWNVDDGNDNNSSVAHLYVEVDDASPAQDQVGGAMVFGTTATTGNVPTERMRITNGGLVGINETANTFMEIGLTINQGGGDKEVLAFKSSDILHGVSANTEIDTYGRFKKHHATEGGLQLEGFSGNTDTSAGTTGLFFRGSHMVDNTTKGAGALGQIMFQASLRSGTGDTTPGTDANLLVIRSHGAAKFIFDQEGQGHSVVAWTTFAKHDDISIINDMESELLLHEDDAKTDRRHALEDLGVIGKDSWHMENDKPRAMVNFTKLSMLHHGALIQIGQGMQDQSDVIEDQAKRISILEQKLLAA